MVSAYRLLARCCWPVPRALSLSAVTGPVPEVAKLGSVAETESFVEG